MRRHLPSPAMVVALIALGVALGGSAVAGTGFITGAQIKDHSIGLNDLAPKAVAHLRGQRGPAGIDGADGLQGDQGPAGAAGGFNPAKVQIVNGTPLAYVGPNTTATATASCPTGTTEVGGGGYSSVAKMILSGPGTNAGPGWTIGVYNDTTIGIPNEVRAYVLCAGP